MRTRKSFARRDWTRRVELNILQWNAGGLSQAKKAELIHTLKLQDINVFAIMEANLTETSINFYHIPGYNLYLLPKFRKVASGLLVGVKNELMADFEVCKEMGDSEDKSEITKTNVWKEGCHFTVYALYIPPASKPNLSCLDIAQKTIIIGDFNAHSMRWGYKDYNAAGLEIEDLLGSHPLDLIYSPDDPPTYIHYNGSSTSPDLLCVSSDIGMYTKRRVIDDPGSGHRQVVASISLPRLRGFDRERRFSSWNFKKADWRKYENLTDEKLHARFFDFNCHPSKIISKINGEILSCAKLSIPRGKVIKFRPFWSGDLKAQKEKRDRLRNKAALTKRPIDVVCWRKQAAIFKRAVLEAKRKSFDKFISNINYKEDSLKTYRFMSHLQNKKSSTRREPMTFRGRVLTDDSEIANAFGQSYAAIQRKGSYARSMSRHLKKERSTTLKTKQDDTDPNDIFNIPFNIQELNNAINGLVMKKSPGEDFIHGEFLKYMGDIAKETVLAAFNCIWETGCVPSIWKRATIVPILKKDKQASQIESYRPISLSSILGKTMERLVLNRLNWFLEVKGLLVPQQAGFRKNRSTNDQVALFSQTVKDALDSRGILSAVYIDFKNAYDLVWRERLLQKLMCFGIGGKMFLWMKSFLDQRLCKVKYGNGLSKSFNLQTGLPQGAVSSCVMFNIYINDLVSCLESIDGINCLLYADDLIIWTQAPKKNAKVVIEKRLIEALEALSTWCTENNMSVNLEKTAVQSFSLTHQAFCPNLIYCGTTIKTTNKFKYLGVTFDNKLTWKPHIEELSERVLNRINVLKRLTGSKWGCARSTLNLTYKTFILPLITYCCEPLITCSESLIGKLEVVQNKALRIVTGAVKTTPIEAMLLLTKNRSVYSIIEERALLLFEKLIRSEIPFWTSYHHQARNLKTQFGYIQKIQSLRENFEFCNAVQKILKPQNPIESVEILSNLNLKNAVLKSQTAPEILKSLALETIHGTYPESHWFHVYTDGSYSDSHMSAGSGVYSDCFSFYASAGKYRTAFDGEVHALLIALKQMCLLHFKFERVVLLSDSQAAIQAISSSGSTLSDSVLQCRELIRLLAQKKKIVVLQWIPSHCGIFGNEQADLLARKGSQLFQPTYSGLSYHSVKLYIKNIMKLKFYHNIRERIKIKHWNETELENVPDKPRRDAVALFRLLTGHDCLAEHLHRIHILDNPECCLCDSRELMNRKHLHRCRTLHDLESETARYWRARELMGL